MITTLKKNSDRLDDDTRIFLPTINITQGNHNSMYDYDQGEDYHSGSLLDFVHHVDDSTSSLKTTFLYLYSDDLVFQLTLK